jgi:hypothetical protein
MVERLLAIGSGKLRIRICQKKNMVYSSICIHASDADMDTAPPWSIRAIYADRNPSPTRPVKPLE